MAESTAALKAATDRLQAAEEENEGLRERCALKARTPSPSPWRHAEEMGRRKIRVGPDMAIRSGSFSGQGIDCHATPKGLMVGCRC